MVPVDAPAALSELPNPAAAVVLRPVKKVALGVAFGTAGALSLGLLAAVHAGFIPGDDKALLVWLMGNVLPGYAPTWVGALLGVAWGFGLGFILGVTLAAVRNGGLSVWATSVCAREQLRVDREFLDEI